MFSELFYRMRNDCLIYAWNHAILYSHKFLVACIFIAGACYPNIDRS